MSMQIAEVGEFDLNEWDDDGITGLDQVWPEYEGMYGLGLTEPATDWGFGDVGCPSCMGGFDAVADKGGGFPWGTVLIGVGGVGVGILAAVLIKKALKK